MDEARWRSAPWHRTMAAWMSDVAQRHPATWKHGWSKHGSSIINSVVEGFMLEPCLLQPCFHVAGSFHTVRNCNTQETHVPHHTVLVHRIKYGVA